MNLSVMYIEYMLLEPRYCWKHFSDMEEANRFKEQMEGVGRKAQLIDWDEEQSPWKRAKELGCHPWELMWGLDSEESRIFREKPGHPIYYYEAAAQFGRGRGAWFTDTFCLRMILHDMGYGIEEVEHRMAEVFANK